MAKASTSRGPTVAFAVIVAVIAALGLYWRSRSDAPRADLAARMTPSPGAAVSKMEPLRRAAHPSPPRAPETRPAAVPLEPEEPTSQPQPLPTPSVVDLATVPHAREIVRQKGDERFDTDEFRQEAMQHPELYFELAERIPELNRPEERRDTLTFFLTYREKLQRDLEGAPENSSERQEILATIARYDDAIARLRPLVDAEDAN